MNILIFGRGPRAEALVGLYLQDVTNKVTWLLATNQENDDFDELFSDAIGDALEIWTLKEAGEKLRRPTDFDVAHIITLPMHSPATGNPFNQPHLDSILEIIDSLGVRNERKITTINSSLMAIGGNARALFGFNYLNYVYMPFLPIDYRDNYTTTARDTKTFPVFPTQPPHTLPVSIVDENEVNIPSILYVTNRQHLDMLKLERMAFHAFSAQLVMQQVSTEMMMLETLTGEYRDGTAMISAVAGLTGFDLEYRPWVSHHQAYLGSIAQEHYAKPGYLLLAGSAAHANGVHVIQARAIMKEFNESSAKHICIDGYDAYTTNNGMPAACEIADLLAAEIGRENIYIVEITDEVQSLPERWNHEDVFNVMVASPTGFSMPEVLLSGHTEFDIIV